MLLAIRALRRGAAPAGRAWGPAQSACGLASPSATPPCATRYRSRSMSSLDAKVQAEIMERSNELHASFIQPLNDKVHGPLEKSNTGGYQSTKMPFVFVLGNHSSGKSSFINYVLGRNIQTAGVAPTDDSFTIIAPGPSDIDQDGPALVGDPDMGFAGLRQFGPTLVHHAELKVRSGTSTNSFMMVDSPGMIDSPVSRPPVYEADMSDTLTGRRKKTDATRGYDFEGVVRWFAERADVIMLFFDPDKPGTTGETLSILTNSLTGMDHKLYIVLNKADQFKKIHDFARAYGSLCWNLSKVILRKDLPRIYTMCLPVTDKNGAVDVTGDLGEGHLSLSSGLQDLETTRDEVKAEVMKAPKRRIDNVITRLTDSLHLLQVHTTILEALHKDYQRTRIVRHGATFSVLAAGGGLAGSSVYFGAPLEMAVGVAATTLVAVGSVQYLNTKALKSKEADMISIEGLNHYFSRRYTRELAEGDESIAASWQRIRDNLHLTLTSLGLNGVGRVKSSEQKELKRILDSDIPALRRQAAPVQFSFFGTTSRRKD
ncbi:unnamed protein product [Ascophyllum nodosum]